MVPMPTSPVHSAWHSVVACLSSGWEFLVPMVILSPRLMPAEAGRGLDPCTLYPNPRIHGMGLGPGRIPTGVSEHVEHAA